jgi:hypothetical protein
MGHSKGDRGSLIEVLEGRTLLSAAVAPVELPLGSSPANPYEINVANGSQGGIGGETAAGQSTWFRIRTNTDRDWRVHLTTLTGTGGGQLSPFVYFDANNNGAVNKGEGVVVAWTAGVDGVQNTVDGAVVLPHGDYFVQVRNGGAATASYTLGFDLQFAQTRPTDGAISISPYYGEDLFTGERYPSLHYGSIKAGNSDDYYRIELFAPRRVDVAARYRTTADDDAADALYLVGDRALRATPTTGLSSDFFADFDGDGRMDVGEEVTPGTVLAPGVYYLHVYGAVPPGDPYLPYLVESGGDSATINTMATAATWGGVRYLASTGQPVGVLNGVAAANASDYYRLDVAAKAALRATLSATRGNPELQLIRDLDNDGVLDKGELAARSAKPADRSDRINLTLDAGTWFVRVLNPGKRSSKYTLSLTGTFIPPTDPGLGFPTAYDIGAFASGAVNDTMNGGDRRDYYRFTLGSSTRVSLLLESLTGDANVQLFRDANSNGAPDDGELVAESGNAGAAVDSIARTLAAGTYYVRIARATTANTQYRFTFRTA